MFQTPSLALVAATLLLSACASTGGSSHASSDQITSAEIETSSATNALELIERLRPRWLRDPARGSISGGIRSQVVLVYLDGNRLGDINSLRSLSTSGIRSMQWLDAARASTVLPEIGSEPIAGAIVIKTN